MPATQVDVQKQSKILDFLRAKSVERVGIVCHNNADPDSFCSAYALSLLLKHLNIESTIIAPEGLNEVAKHLLPQYDCRVASAEAATQAEVLILIDVCSIDQIGELAETLPQLQRPIIMIDHHAENSSLSQLAEVKLIDEEAVSVAELVYQLYQDSGIAPTRLAAQSLLAAIIYDSRHLMLATPRTLEIVLALLATGIQYSEVVQSLRIPIDLSERIARLKSAQRLDFERINDYLVATTHVGSFEASAARALIDLGADVAVVIGGNEDELRISARSKDEFYAKTGVHLGRDILEGLGKKLGGGGGGHPTAAGASGAGVPEKVRLECVRLLREAILLRDTQK